MGGTRVGGESLKSQSTAAVAVCPGDSALPPSVSIFWTAAVSSQPAETGYWSRITLACKGKPFNFRDFINGMLNITITKY